MSLETFVSPSGGGIIKVTLDLESRTLSWDGQRVQYTGQVEYFNRGFRSTGKSETIYWVYNAPPKPVDHSFFK